ncbi:chromodomain Y-like protein 2 isoform X1 [Biomphalaria pfeifferi]|uniref:Chromodomain Y-like protein 2 isoform X1 n=1 Tax=Biomphalaria pfeifferi TaxID=112525 RepID=A0AAD8B2X5_BIOPF|nr:chromodomain Y-like protein 2 isoform X1 [Biomphalaria pfeifferi]
MAEDRLYEVEQILGKKVVGSQSLFLVRWRGFSSEHDSWEPYRNLKSCKPLLKLFKQANKSSRNKTESVLQNIVPNVPEQNFDSKNLSSDLMGTKVKSVKRIKSLRQKKLLVGDNNTTRPVKVRKLNLVSKAKSLPNTENIVQSTENRSINTQVSAILNNIVVHESLKKAKKRKLTENELSSYKKIQIIPKLSKNRKSEFVTRKRPKVIKNKIDSQTESEPLKRRLRRESSPSKGKNCITEFVLSNEQVWSDQALQLKEQVNNDDSQSLNGQNCSLESLPLKELSKSRESHINSGDVESDDDILYSLNPDCDTSKIKNRLSKTKLSLRKSGAKEKTNSSKSASSVIHNQNSKSGLGKDKLKKFAKKRKSLSLIDSKKKSKDWLSKSGLLRSASPPPFFTSVKHMIGSSDRMDPSVLQGHSLPDQITPEASETYLADVPSSYPVAAEEPLVNEQTINAGSLSYKSLLDCLPEQLHPGHKNDKKVKNGASGSDCSSSSGAGGSLFSTTLSSSFGGESVERRTSVRSTECVFRYKQIVVKKCLRYTQIWLNTQTVMQNALNPQVIQEIVSALNSAKYDDSHLVLFSSLGNVFCSGTDLHFLVSGDRKMAARQMTDAIREVTKTFITFPKPIIAAVSGAVVGLGVSLLALCDVVYASDKASFHFPYSQLSQTPEGCSSFTLPLTVGLPSANELLYGGRKITAMEAYQQGLVSQVFWPTLMMQEVIPRTQNMANCSAKALEATKLLIRSHHRTKMELTNETECNLLLERWTSTECQRTIEAYISNEKNFTF